MRKYTKKEVGFIKRRKEELTNGRCECLDLIEALVDGIITQEEHQAIKMFEIRCPLSVSGKCKKGVVTGDEIDMYQAVRDLGLMQMRMFSG